MHVVETAVTPQPTPAPVRCSTGLPRGPEEVELLLTLMDRMRAHLSAVAAEYDLTPQQAITLHHLHDEAGLPMRELAGMLRCDASNITGIADRLEAAGLVERRTSPLDRRVKALVATEAGRRVRAELGVRMAALPPPIAALDPQERALLVVLLRKMTAPAPTG